MTNNDSGQQPNLDQQEFDKQRLEQSPAQRRAMVKGLAELARSKIKSETDSFETDTSAQSSQKSE